MWVWTLVLISPTCLYQLKKTYFSTLIYAWTKHIYTAIWLRKFLKIEISTRLLSCPPLLALYIYYVTTCILNFVLNSYGRSIFSKRSHDQSPQCSFYTFRVGINSEFHDKNSQIDCTKWNLGVWSLLFSSMLITLNVLLDFRWRPFSKCLGL